MKKKEMKKQLEKEKRGMREYQLNNTDKNIKNVIIITCCVVAFIGLMFVFTKIKTGEWNLFTKENNIFYTAEAQTEKILCGSILNRSDEENYVLAYQMQEDNASL